MGQRNMTVDLEMEQQQSRASLHPEPCILLGSFPQQPDNNSIPAMVANVPNLEAHFLQDLTYDNSSMFFALPQYHHHHRRAAANYYLPYVAYQAPPGHLPASSSHGVVGVSSDYFMDHTRGSYKRKNTEVIPLPRQPQYFSTLQAPFNTPETVAPFGGARNRPGAVAVNPVLPPHAPNNFVQENYAGHHPFPAPGSVWFEQHHGRSDGPPSFWPHAPYMLGSNNVPGSVESSSRNPAAFMYLSQLNQRDHYYSHHHHLAPPPVQAVIGQSATLYPHMVSSASYRVPPGSFAPQNTMTSGPPESEMGSVQPTGFRIYQHHERDDSAPVATLRQHRGVPRLRVMPDDEVALLEFEDFGGLGNNHVDHHHDMRLDIEEMSYEELLALSERIGTVNTGLPEEEVKNHLKTRTCSGINLKKESSSPRTNDSETEPCTICQENFKNEEKIATLDCRHEYHAECLEKWLIVKNVCPICKAEALGMEKRKILVYGFLMYIAATYFSSGSELLLEILGHGIIGGLFLPMLGALPDAMLILGVGVSYGITISFGFHVWTFWRCINCSSPIAVGMGWLAGSTVILLTVIWGTGTVVGKCDIQNFIALKSNKNVSQLKTLGIRSLFISDSEAATKCHY